MEKSASNGNLPLRMAGMGKTCAKSAGSSMPLRMAGMEHYADARMQGQLVSTELIICSSIFMVALVIFLLAWNTITAAYYEEQANRDMEVALMGISDMAVLSPGSPADWETTAGANANAFGFAQSRNILSSQKLSMLSNLSSNYTSVKEKMGAGRFDMFITVLSADGSRLPYSFGSEAGNQNDSAVSFSAERLAILGSEPVRLKVQVWRPRGIGAQ